MLGKSIDQIVMGQEASFTKTITETDVYNFGGVTGDLNPAHFNSEYAKNTMFKERIAHGMLVSSLFSTVFGMQLPGPGAIYLGQEVKFTKPVYFNDTITATVKVIEKNLEKNRVVFETTASNQDGDVVVIGKATLMPPKKAK